MATNNHTSAMHLNALCFRAFNRIVATLKHTHNIWQRQTLKIAAKPDDKAILNLELIESLDLSASNNKEQAGQKMRGIQSTPNLENLINNNAGLTKQIIAYAAAGLLALGLTHATPACAEDSYILQNGTVIYQHNGQQQIGTMTIIDGKEGKITGQNGETIGTLRDGKMYNPQGQESNFYENLRKSKTQQNNYDKDIPTIEEQCGNQASCYIQKADEMIKNKEQPEKIIKIYNQGIKNNPNTASLYIALADFYIKVYNDIDKVIELYNNALLNSKSMNNKDKVLLLSYLAHRYYSKNNYKKSKELFKEVLKYEPNNEEVKGFVSFLEKK